MLVAEISNERKKEKRRAILYRSVWSFQYYVSIDWFPWRHFITHRPFPCSLSTVRTFPRIFLIFNCGPSLVIPRTVWPSTFHVVSSSSNLLLSVLYVSSCRAKRIIIQDARTYIESRFFQLDPIVSRKWNWNLYRIVNGIMEFIWLTGYWLATIQWHCESLSHKVVCNFIIDRLKIEINI